MKDIKNYLLERYGKDLYEPNIYMYIEELQEKISSLTDEINEMRIIFKNLQSSIEAVDNRIDIILGEKK